MMQASEKAKQYANRFMNASWIISIVAVLFIVKEYGPNPGHLLPLSWDVAIAVGVLTFSFFMYWLGFLFGRLSEKS